MVILVGGPPHSGKTVFIDALASKLPRDKTTTVRACPDGESFWSNGMQQIVTRGLRRKGPFSKWFLDKKRKEILEAKEKFDIVIVDVGGMIDRPDKKVFIEEKLCDKCIIVSSDEEAKKEWEEKCAAFDMECIASIISEQRPLNDMINGSKMSYLLKKTIKGVLKGDKNAANKLKEYRDRNTGNKIERLKKVTKQRRINRLSGKEIKPMISDLDQNEIYSSFTNNLDVIKKEGNCLRGKIFGLERGVKKCESPVIRGIVKDILRRDKENNKEPGNDDRKDSSIKVDDKDDSIVCIDGNKLNDIAMGARYNQHTEVYDVNTEKKVPLWERETIRALRGYLEKHDFSGKKFFINDVRMTHVLGTLIKGLKNSNAESIKIYDPTNNMYVPIKQLKKEKGITSSDNLNYTLLENDKSIFMYVEIAGNNVEKQQRIKEAKEEGKEFDGKLNRHLTLEQFNNCVLPELDGNKDLYISGQIPLYLYGSIVNSYDQNRIYAYSPRQNMFTCIDSKVDKNEVAKCVNGPEGIAVTKFHVDREDKKENKNKESRFSKLFNFLRRKKKLKELPEGEEDLSKYYDDNVVQYEVDPVEKRKEDIYYKIEPKDKNEELDSNNKTNKIKDKNKDSELQLLEEFESENGAVAHALKNEIKSKNNDNQMLEMPYERKNNKTRKTPKGYFDKKVIDSNGNPINDIGGKKKNNKSIEDK